MKTSSQKVLCVTQPTIGGAALHVLQLATGLDASAFDVSIASPADGWLRERALAAGVAHHPVGLVRAISPANDLRAFLELRALIRRTHPDVLHLHSSKAGFLGRLAGRLARVPTIVYTPHGFAFNQSHGATRVLYLWLERLAGPLADRIVCVSPSEKALALRVRIAGEGRFAVIANGVDAAAQPIERCGKLRTLVGAGDDTLIVGMVARLARPKLPEDLVRAGAALARELPRGRLCIAFIGSGPLEEPTRRLAAGLGVQDIFAFLGDRDDVPDLLPDLDVFVLATASEGAPYTILEAMAAAKPVVASRVGGVTDLVAEGSTGMLCAPGRPDELAAALRSLLGNAELRRRFGAAARQRVEREFTASRMVAETEALYRSLLEGARRS